MIDWTELRWDFDEAGKLVGSELVFSHVDDKTGVVRHFAIERIQKHIEHMAAPPRIITFPLDPVFASFAMVHRGIEPHRFNRITAEDLIRYPIVLAHMPGVGRDVQGEHLIIDGSHRYCRAVQMGWKELHGYEVPPEIWEQYLVSIPEELADWDRERLSTSTSIRSIQELSDR